jgi:hypothetical protein
MLIKLRSRDCQLDILFIRRRLFGGKLDLIFHSQKDIFISLARFQCPEMARLLHLFRLPKEKDRNDELDRPEASSDEYLGSLHLLFSHPSIDRTGCVACPLDAGCRNTSPVRPLESDS